MRGNEKKMHVSIPLSPTLLFIVHMNIQCMCMYICICVCEGESEWLDACMFSLLHEYICTL